MPAANHPSAATPVHVFSPGRVNLMGDHTDYNQGMAVPMAIDLGTVVTFAPDRGPRVVLSSAWDHEPADIDVHLPLDPEAIRAIRPHWARYVGAMVAAIRPRTGGRGTVDSTLPVGAGLSSSASLEVAVALALGFDAEPVTMARTCQRAEQAATGVKCGLMDQLAITAGVEGCALLVDFSDLSMGLVRIPEGVEVLAVHSGSARVLERSGYAARQAECEAAAHRLGPLGLLDPEAVIGLPDPTLRRRARHVITECDRVRWFAAALKAGDLVEAGRLMSASHVSLAKDFEVSTPALDQLVEHLISLPGVYGARLTGAGFGGCVVALAAPEAVDLAALPTAAWRLRPSRGAHLLGRW